MRSRLMSLFGVTQDAKKSFVKKSYSQCGEDLIVDHLFGQLRIEKPTFMDIGAHHPNYLNNTYLFYLKGCRGINIEPDPNLISAFNEKRNEDINLNIGIGIQSGSADFYVMNEPALNTFMKEEAERIERESAGYKIAEVRKLQVRTVNEIVSEYGKGAFPDFLSIDVEGLDDLILRSMDYSKRVPKVMCVETLTFEPQGRGHKRQDLIEFIKSQGYLVYADTYINTIFVKATEWLP